MALTIDNTFRIDFVTRNPLTGAYQNADTAGGPTVTIYEDTETATGSGAMGATVVNRDTGKYYVQVTTSAVNGFETGKSYNIHVEATVGGVTMGAVIFTFGIATYGTSDVYNGLFSDARSEPGQGALAEDADLAEKIDYIYKFMRNKVTNDGTDIEVYNDAGDTVDHKASVSEATGGIVTRDEFATGP